MGFIQNAHCLIEPHKTMPVKEKTQIEIQKQIEHEYKLIGKMKVVPGLKLWELDYDKKELNLATFIDTKAFNVTTGKKAENKRVNMNPKAFYFQAHCRRTAIKKANKIFFRIFGNKNYFTN